MADNTLNLVGDGDDSEIVRTVASTFGIEFGDDELTDTHNVGQFYDLILRKHRAVHPASRACLTQAAFYRLRRALAQMGLDQSATPSTPLSSVLPPPADRKAVRLIWQELERRTGLTLPRRQSPRTRWDDPMSTAQAWAFWGCSATLFFALALALTTVTGAHFGLLLFLQFVSVVALVTITEIAFATTPQRLATIGDLAREAAGYSFAALQPEKGGCSPSDVWYALSASLRDASGHKAPIDRATTFFAKT